MSDNTQLSELDKLLAHFANCGGSDLFITAGRPATMKKNKELVNLTEAKLRPEMCIELCTQIMTASQLHEFHEHQECNFAYHIDHVARFRVNVFLQRGTPGMVIRSVNTEIPDLQTLRLPPILKELIQEKNGLILIVGSAGSGKSTTLASLIDIRNQTQSGHIITIEDPIEFMHPHKKSIVNQREVGVDTPSYQSALENTLRQSPDVILIGEIRTRETMEHALAFAETGHLCLSTLHANNTNQTLDRIINFFPPEDRNHILMDLSLNLKAVVSQRLVPKVGGGLIAAVEVLIATPRVSELIFQGNVTEIKEIMKKSTAMGMQTFDKALFDLYEDGLITYSDAIRSADSANDLRLDIKLNSKLPPPEEVEVSNTQSSMSFSLKQEE